MVLQVSAARRSRVEWVAWLAAYLAGGALSVALQPDRGPALWYPPIAIGIAAVLRLGPGALVLVLGCELAISTARFASPSAGAIVAVTTCVEAAVGWALLRGHPDVAMLRQPETFLRVAAAGAVAAAVAALGGTFALGLVTTGAVYATPPEAFEWWFGDTTTLVTLLPALLALIRATPPDGRDVTEGPAGMAERVALTVALFACGVLITGLGAHDNHGALFAVVVVPVLWAALRTGLRQTAWMIIVAGVVVTGAAALFHTGTEAGDPTLDLHRVDAQVVLIVTSIAGFALAVVIETERRLRQRARLGEALAETSRARLQGIVDTALVGIISIDANLRITAFNPAAETMFGWSAAEMVGQPLDRLLPADRAGLHRIHIEGFAAGGHTARHMGDWRHVSGLRRNGSTMPLLAVISKVVADGDLTMTVMLTDMSQARDFEARSRFLAAASHDMRQPLQAMTLLMAVLERRLTDAAAIGVVANLKQALRSLHGMFDNLLDLARLDGGRTRARVEEVALAPMFERLRQEWQPLAESKGLDLRIVSTQAAVASDGESVERILRNLVSNALKYTVRGRVLIGCRTRNGRVVVEVRDTGPGIAADQQERIFDEFTRLRDAPGSSGVDGLGLGLAIVRRLSDALGARVTLRSAVGAGSCFAVDLGPRLALQAPKSDVDERAPTTTAERTTCRVLIVEDHELARDALASALLAMDAEPVPLDSAAAFDAWFARGEAVDLALFDLDLGDGRRGVDLARRLAEDRGPATRIVIVTGRTDAATIRELEAERWNWMSKPIDGDKLLDLLEASTPGR
jgi:PAS domain S-box-containing protein